MTDRGTDGNGGDPGGRRSSGTDGLLARLVDVRREEVRAMLLSAAFFFFVFCAYFMLRPIRDEIAVASGVRNLKWLFLGTLTATLVCNPLFSWLVVKLPVRRLIPVTYHLFAASLVVFFFVRRGAPAGSEHVLNIAFWIWISVMALFVPSVFWSVMADAWRSDQAKRLFGFIGLGGTLGSVVGSALTAELARRIGTANLFLVSALMFEIGVFVVSRMLRAERPRARALPDGAAEQQPDDAADRSRAIGGSAWAGIYNVMRSPYLFAIASFLIMYTIGSTILYAQQTEIVGRYYQDRELRTQLLAQVEMTVQILTLVTQAFFTGRIIRWIGLGAALAFMPALTGLGFLVLGSMPVPMTLFAFVILRRASNFALTNPSMEALFTVVSREDKYKAKSFIETFVYRGGDQVAVWVNDGLLALGLGVTGISYSAIPMCVVWLGVGVWLGRRQTRLARREGAISPADVASLQGPGLRAQGQGAD
jgi:AAA family ATP:ADP antiporter